MRSGVAVVQLNPASRNKPFALSADQLAQPARQPT